MNDRFLEKYNAYKLGWLHDSLRFIIAIAALFVFFRFVVGFSVVDGDSMNPTLKDGTIVLYLRTVSHYTPGDVICMHVPSGEYYVKRVAAVGGDTVDLEDGILYVNNEQAADEWASGTTEEEAGAVIYPYAVREGNVFVLGDNRQASMDSRAFGEVNRRQIKGKILLQIGSGGIRTVR